MPYQWDALNDRIEGADKSYCIRNFRTAARVNKLREQGIELPEQPTDDFISLPRGNAMLPENEKEDNAFYGYVFQDSDLYKWIEAVSYSLTNRADPALEHTVDEMIDLMEEAMLTDGYLDTFYSIKNPSKRFSNLRDHHELYCFGHLAEAAVAYSEATGKDKLLHLAERFADLICQLFGEEEGKCHGYPGHELAEMALVRLYRHTGKEDYLDMAKYFVLQRGKEPIYFREEHGEKDSDMRYYQAQQEVLEQMEAVGHAVRAMYLYSGLTDLAVEYEDDALAKVAKRLWKNVTRKKMYITGGVGATNHGEAFSFAYDLPADSAYAETCAAIGLVFWAKRMLALQPKGEYADVMERALYNSVLSGISLDGTEFFYTNPLEVQPKACKEDERLWHVKSHRAKWFGCACCPPNLARMIGSITKYIAHHQEDTTWIDLYIGCQMQTQWQGKTVDIEMTGKMPYASEISIQLHNPDRAEGTIALRIPSWAEQWRITIETAGERQIVSAEGRQSVPTDEENAGVTIDADKGQDHAAGQAKIECRFADGYLYVTLHGQETVGYQMPGWRKRGNNTEQPLYHQAAKDEYEAVILTWVPYYAWANREEGEMRVWIYKK
ncbi:MAG: glycoside hydrolase family 127 protein [Lachnospiraceae bacterium]|nr:glycoside hydrolase family 127 protein [Lachnospiraceae bacterium]